MLRFLKNTPNISKTRLEFIAGNKLDNFYVDLNRQKQLYLELKAMDKINDEWKLEFEFLDALFSNSNELVKFSGNSKNLSIRYFILKKYDFSVIMNHFKSIQTPDTETLVIMGQYLHSIGKSTLALQIMENCTEYDVLIQRAIILNDLEKYREALEHLTRVSRKGFKESRELMQEFFVTLSHLRDKRCWQYFSQLKDPPDRVLKAITKQYSWNQVRKELNFNIKTPDSAILGSLFKGYLLNKNEQSLVEILECIPQKQQLEQQFIRYLIENNRTLLYERLEQTMEFQHFFQCIEHALNTNDSSLLEMILKIMYDNRIVVPISHLQILVDRYGKDHLFIKDILCRKKPFIYQPYLFKKQ